MIDLSNPAHVEALRQACADLPTLGFATRDAARSLSHNGPVLPGQIDPWFHAVAAIVDPAPAADLLSRLLERCGFCRGVAHGEPTLDAWVNDSGTEIDARTPSETSVTGYASWTIRIANIPRLVLALLDAPDRAAAMAALRGAA